MQQIYSPEGHGSETERQGGFMLRGKEARPSVCSEMMFIHAFEAVLRQRFVAWPLQSDVIMVLHCSRWMRQMIRTATFAIIALIETVLLEVTFDSLRSFTAPTKPWARL